MKLGHYSRSSHLVWAVGCPIGQNYGARIDNCTVNPFSLQGTVTQAWTAVVASVDRYPSSREIWSGLVARSPREIYFQGTHSEAVWRASWASVSHPNKRTTVSLPPTYWEGRTAGSQAGVLGLRFWDRVIWSRARAPVSTNLVPTTPVSQTIVLPAVKS